MTKGPCLSGASQLSRWLDTDSSNQSRCQVHLAAEREPEEAPPPPSTHRSSTGQLMGSPSPLEPTEVLDQESGNSVVRQELGQVTLGLNLLICKAGMRMPRSDPNRRQCPGLTGVGHETRTGHFWGWTQTGAPTGLAREGSGPWGGEAREKPLPHWAASSRQAPDERDLRNVLVQASPTPRPRAFIHFKSGLLWAFPGVGVHFGEEILHTAFLSTKQINLPGSSGLPMLGSSLLAVLHIPIKPGTPICPSS